MDADRRGTTDEFCAGGLAGGDSADEFSHQRLAADSGGAVLSRDSGAVFYRGNRRTEITFDTTRLFSDQVTAESFILLHETQFPGQFLATFTAGRSGGGANASRYLKNAMVEAVGSSLTGCTTKHSYRILGGIMTTTPN